MVTRSYNWHWKSKKASDSVTTASDGGFAFDAVFADSFSGKWMPHEPVIEQQIVIEHGGSRFEAYIKAKRDYDENSELNGRAFRLECELNRTPDFDDTYEFFGLGSPQ